MGEKRCPTCGETKPRTGSCGAAHDDTRALCKQPTPTPPSDDAGRVVAYLAGGLTIRAELAARAMQGILASGMYGSMHEVVAERAIQCADALIAELNKTASGEGEGK